MTKAKRTNADKFMEALARRDARDDNKAVRAFIAHVNAVPFTGDAIMVATVLGIIGELNVTQHVLILADSGTYGECPILRAIRNTPHYSAMLSARMLRLNMR